VAGQLDRGLDELPTNNRIVLQWQYNRENNEFVELSPLRYKEK
jgi:hypothetical protein